MNKINKIGVILLAWMLAGALITLYDHFILRAHMQADLALSYSFIENFLLNVGVGAMAAITGGSFLVLVVNEKHHSLSYWKSILLVIASFLLVSSGLIFLVSWIQSLYHPGTDWKFFLVNSIHLKNILVWGVVVGLTQLMLQINDKFGQGVLFHLITGRYHQPREETRIFMIVDIMSSTTIAEKLKRDQYHLFLRDFFADITSPILLNRGEIYQYVGDEIVISWNLKDKDVDARCLWCYFDNNKRSFHSRINTCRSMGWFLNSKRDCTVAR